MKQWLVSFGIMMSAFGAVIGLGLLYERAPETFAKLVLAILVGVVLFGLTVIVRSMVYGE